MRTPDCGPGTTRTPRLVLVGVAGYGRVHAERIATLQAAGSLRLVAAVDPVCTVVPQIISGTPLYPDLPQALASVGPVDVVVIAAPIPEHASLTELALDAGADVLLEKPPVASFDDFARLLAAEARTGRVVQVGFQSLGSQGLAALRDGSLGIGEIERVTATGAWSRTAGYWSRSPWAGRRQVDGRPVVDGVVTNPLAHATATALALVGARRAEDVSRVDTDLYRANPIDADDTAAVRILTSTGFAVTCAYTLCAQEQTDPVVQVTGSRGRADFFYTRDLLQIQVDGQRREVSVGREDLLENLLAFRRDGTELLVPLSSTGAFMRVLEAVAATDPVRVGPPSVRWSGEGADRRPVIIGIEQDLKQVVETGRTFAELGLAWTQDRIQHQPLRAPLDTSPLDRDVKRERLLAILDRHGAEALVLTSAPSLNWYLEGARTHVSLAAGPVLSVRVSRTGDQVWLSDNESARLCAEELPADVDLHERPWYAPVPTPEGIPESALTRELWAARWPLLPGEKRRFADLGRDAATVLTSVLSTIGPETTERQVAAEVSRGVAAVGADPLVVLVGGEARAGLPHPLPTEAPIGRRALVVLCARRHGLIADLSRIVAFEPATAAEHDRQQAVFEVERAAFDATRPGARLSEVLAEIATAYGTVGFGPDHWRGHHQGGMAGYDGRDPRATPLSDHPIAVGQAFAWNPWAPAAKVEDTVLLGEAGLEVLSADPSWPTVEVAGRSRPDVLFR